MRMTIKKMALKTVEHFKGQSEQEIMGMISKISTEFFKEVTRWLVFI